MKKLVIKASVYIGVLLLTAAGCVFGKQISFSEQWPLFEALRTTAAIIFAVVGAWLAIIYPERLRSTFRPTEEHSHSTKVDMGSFLSPAINSTAILAVVLLVGILAPMAKQLDFFLENKYLFRGLSFGLLVALTCWQLITIVATLSPVDFIKTESDKENAEDYILKELTKQNGKL